MKRHQGSQKDPSRQTFVNKKHNSDNDGYPLGLRLEKVVPVAGCAANHPRLVAAVESIEEARKSKA